MYFEVKAKVHKENAEGTVLRVLVPHVSLTDQLAKYSNNGILRGELRIDDGRTITGEQRRKYWATIRDISRWNGDDKDDNHEELKDMYCAAIGIDDFSMSNCSVSLARDYITFILNFCIRWGVQLSEPILDRTDDIDAMLYLALKHRRCIICGEDGEHHHWDAIGMGRDRKTYDDSVHRKICLCRDHHSEAHQIGRDSFGKKHHVYGIVYRE